jgi:hypothetical protein
MKRVIIFSFWVDCNKFQWNSPVSDVIKIRSAVQNVQIFRPHMLFKRLARLLKCTVTFQGEFTNSFCFVIVLISQISFVRIFWFLLKVVTMKNTVAREVTPCNRHRRKDLSDEPNTSINCRNVPLKYQYYSVTCTSPNIYIFSKNLNFRSTNIMFLVFLS